MKKCTLALGCFWKPEENFKNKPGIIETEVGYAGGNSSQTTYEEVCTGDTGHAEVVRLTFDENIISFKKILDLFFKMHDPTQKDMQFPDVGTQYRSEIFYENEEQREIANKVKEKSLEIYNLFITNNIEVFYDDRDVSPGVKFSDANLMGNPYQIVISEGNIQENLIEVIDRRDQSKSKVKETELLGLF